MFQFDSAEAARVKNDLIGHQHSVNFEMENVSKNLEFWMTNLPTKLKCLPLIYLAIPGSHDSTTYAITKHSNISPDVRNPIQYLTFLEPILRPVLYKWSVTQSTDITQQLKAGIRYFDLRIATKPHLQGFFFVHNLYSENVNTILQQINNFLEVRPNEIVILDCQHFYKMTSDDHRCFISLIIKIFGRKILPYCKSMTNITLESMTRDNYQVIIIYRADFSIVEELLWPTVCFPTPWPDTTQISQLISKLNQGLKNRNTSVGFISQCVLTPNIRYVCKNIFSCLRDKCVVPLEKPKYDWLNQQTPGNGGLNIVISDFVDHGDYQFPKEVINLNAKLLRNLD